ncbi:MAG: hypothetical protein RRY36_08560 [Bacteroidaceae bacterium]
MELIERTKIEELLARSDDVCSWIVDNFLNSNIHDFEEKANEYAILSVRINNYYKNNKRK